MYHSEIKTIKNSIEYHIIKNKLVTTYKYNIIVNNIEFINNLFTQGNKKKIIESRINRNFKTMAFDHRNVILWILDLKTQSNHKMFNTFY